MKKLLSVILATVMLLSTGLISVMADGETEVNCFTDTTNAANVLLDLDFYVGKGIVDAKGATLSSTPTNEKFHTYVGNDDSTFVYGQVDSSVTSGTQSIVLDSTNYKNLPETTITMWAKMVETSTWPKVFNFGNNGTWRVEGGTNSGNGYLHMLATTNAGDNKALYSAPYLNIQDYVDKWAYYTFTRKYDPETKTITYINYVNGEPLNESKTYKEVAALHDGSQIVFGADGSINDIFKGGLADVKIYNKVLTPEEAKAIYTAQKPKDPKPENYNAIMDLDFGGNDGEAPTITDEAQVFEDVTITQENLKKGTEAKKDGSGNWDYVEFDQSPSQKITIAPSKSGDITNLKKTSLGMWVKFGSVTTKEWPKFFKFSDNWKIELGNGGNPYLMVNTFNDSSIGAPRINLTSYIDKWTYVVFTRELDAINEETNKRDEILKVYFDGVQLFETTQKVTPVDDDKIIIGNYTGGGATDYFKGKIADVKLYEAVLTEEKIAEIYEREKEQKVYANNLMLDLVFSESANGSVVVNDTVTPERSNITVSDGVGYGSYTLKNNNQQGYATFSGDKVQYIKIDDSKAKELLNADETSIEMLVQIPSEADFAGKYRKYFAIGDANGSKDSRTWWSELGSAGGNWLSMYGPSTSNAGYRLNMSKKYGKWVHLVSTRQFDKANGKIVYNTYIDGILMDTAEVTNQSALNDSGYIWIGGIPTNGGTDHYKGGIASFKIYNKILSKVEVGVKYDETRTATDDAIILDVDFSNFKGENPQLSDKAGVVSSLWYGNVTPGTYTNEKGEEIPYAVYDGEGKTAGTHSGDNAGEYIAVSTGQKSSRVMNLPKTTVEMWMKLDIASRPKSYQKFFAFGTNVGKSQKTWWAETGNADGYPWVHTMGKYSTEKNDTITVSGRFNMTGKDGKWAHVVLTREFDEAAQTITYQTYINGVKADAEPKVVTNQTELGDNETSGGVYFGGMYWGSGADDDYIGGIAEARMYNTILDEEAVKSNFNAKADTYLSFEDTHKVLDIDFEKKVDKAGTATKSLWTNGTTLSSFDNGAGVVTPTAVFAGESAEFYALGAGEGSAKLLNLPETSVDMWVKLPKAEEGRYAKFFAIRGSANKGWWIEYGYNGSTPSLSMIIDDNGNKKVGSSIDASDLENTWVHIVLTRKFDTDAQQTIYNAYVNGNKAFNEPYVMEGIKADGTANMAVSFGGNNWNGKVEGQYNDHFKGEMAKAKMYNVALTDAQVLSVYNSEKDNFQLHGEITAELDSENTISYDDGVDDYFTVEGIGDYDNISVAVKINNKYTVDKKITAYGAYYENGKLVDIQLPYINTNNPEKYDVITVTKSTPCTVYFNFEFGKLPTSNGEIKVFIWSGEDGEAMKSYVEPIVIPYVGTASVFTAQVTDYVTPAQLQSATIDGAEITGSYYDFQTQTATFTLNAPVSATSVTINGKSYDGSALTVYEPVKNKVSIKSVALDGTTAKIQVYNPLFTSKAVTVKSGEYVGSKAVAAESVGEITVENVASIEGLKWTIEY